MLGIGKGAGGGIHVASLFGESRCFSPREVCETKLSARGLVKYFFSTRTLSGGVSAQRAPPLWARWPWNISNTHYQPDSGARAVWVTLKSNNPARQQRQTRLETEWNERAQTVQLSRQTHRCGCKSSCFVSVCSFQNSQSVVGRARRRFKLKSEVCNPGSISRSQLVSIDS